MVGIDPVQSEYELMQLSVAVVAADKLAGAGLAALLDEQSGLRVVATYDLAAEPGAVEQAGFEVLIVDLGWEAPEPADEQLEPWLECGLPVLVLLEAEEGSFPLNRLGADGLIARDRDGRVIQAAALALASGLQVMDPELASPLPAPPPISEPLTPREVEVLQLLAEGRSNRAIGQALAISEHTVKFHVTSILTKVGAESRTEAAVIGVRTGLIAL